MSGVSSIILHVIFLRRGLSLTDLGMSAGQRALGSHLSSISPTRGLEALPCLICFFLPWVLGFELGSSDLLDKIFTDCVILSPQP